MFGAAVFFPFNSLCVGMMLFLLSFIVGFWLARLANGVQSDDLLLVIRLIISVTLLYFVQQFTNEKVKTDETAG